MCETVEKVHVTHQLVHPCCTGSNWKQAGCHKTSGQPSHPPAEMPADTPADTNSRWSESLTISSSTLILSLMFMSFTRLPKQLPSRPPSWMHSAVQAERNTQAQSRPLQRFECRDRNSDNLCLGKICRNQVFLGEVGHLGFETAENRKISCSNVWKLTWRPAEVATWVAQVKSGHWFQLLSVTVFSLSNFRKTNFPRCHESTLSCCTEKPCRAKRVDLTWAILAQNQANNSEKHPLLVENPRKNLATKPSKLAL